MAARKSVSGHASQSGIAELTYRGSWGANSISYYAGDLVTYNGQTYYTSTNLLFVPPTAVGQSGTSTTSAKTNATVVTLPTGSQSGDMLIALLCLHPAVSNPTTAQLSLPSWGTVLTLNAFTGTTTTSGVWAALSYTLTSSDITNGYVTIPAQSHSSNGSGSVFDAMVVGFRNLGGIEATRVGTAVASTGVTAFADTGTVASTKSTISLFALMVSDGGGGIPSSPIFSPVTPTTNWMRYASSGTHRGEIVAGYTATTGSSINAETISCNLWTSTSWQAQAVVITVSGVFNTGQWQKFAGTGDLAVNAKDYGAVGDGTTDDTAALQAALTASAAAGVWLNLNGNHKITAQLNVPSGTKLDGSRGAITQATDYTKTLSLTSVTGVVVRDVTVYGKTSDYANSSGVYPAAAVYCTGTTSKVTVEGCTFTGLAGAGVFLDTSVTDVKIERCVMTGAGPTYITSTSYGYSGGIVTYNGTGRWSARNNEISGFAQGIVTGDNMTDVRMTDNYIHDIPGQHGIYCGTVNGAQIARNIIRNTGLTGMKVQVGATGSNDADNVVIVGNIFINTGAQGILITNAVGGTPRLRRVDIIANVLNTCANNGIEANNAITLHIADNLIYNTTNGSGIKVNTASALDVVNNRINTATQNGILITDCTDWIIASNRIMDVASAQISTARFGIETTASVGCSDGTIRDNKITDTLSNMRYGIYIASGDLTTMDLIGNQVSGATDYGYRGVATNARTFRGNSFAGSLGAMLTPPSNFSAVTSPASDSSGTKAAIDAILGVLTANGLTP